MSLGAGTFARARGAAPVRTKSRSERGDKQALERVAECALVSCERSRGEGMTGAPCGITRGGGRWPARPTPPHVRRSRWCTTLYPFVGTGREKGRPRLAGPPSSRRRGMSPTSERSWSVGDLPGGLRTGAHAVIEGVALVGHPPAVRQPCCELHFRQCGGECAERVGGSTAQRHGLCEHGGPTAECAGGSVVQREVDCPRRFVTLGHIGDVTQEHDRLQCRSRLLDCDCLCRRPTRGCGDGVVCCVARRARSPVELSDCRHVDRW